MQTEIVTLGEREYALQELPLRKARAFRENLQTIFSELTETLENTPTAQMNDSAAVATLLRSVSSQVLNSIDTATDLLCEYSPDIQGDREYIEDNAVGSQVVDAFLSILTLVFPFFSANRARRIGQMMGKIGPSDNPTSTN